MLHYALEEGGRGLGEREILEQMLLPRITKKTEEICEVNKEETFKEH